MKLWPALSLSLLALTACSESKPPMASAAPAGDYAAIARGKVAVEGGLVELVAPGGAVFSEVLAKAGTQVNKGDVLARFDNKVATLALAEAKAAAAQGNAQVAALQGRVAAAEQLAQRTRQAATAGALEPQQADEAAQALAQLKAEITVARAGLELGTIRQQQAEHALAQLVLRSPVAGEVIKVQAHAGTSLAGDGPAFVILPALPLQVRAEVNESFLARLHAGSKADVTLESEPQAPALAAHAVRIGKLLEPSVNGSELQPARVVEVILEFDEARNLLVGQNVMVKFHE